VLGAVSAAHKEPKHALGQGVSAVMVLLVVAALLATFKVLPSRLFTPAVIALLVAFPVLIFAEGIIAPVEFLTTLGNVLSYARIMAIGTASVMLALVANQMVGAVGSTAVGLIFALLFHLVNFAIGLFTPAIHALRLHYVEFFGKFYSPGGRRYEPFGHRVPPSGPEPLRKPS
jgi:V/A-type H+-transporting ATPase subunit I